MQYYIQLAKEIQEISNALIDVLQTDEDGNGVNLTKAEFLRYELRAKLEKISSEE